MEKSLKSLWVATIKDLRMQLKEWEEQLIILENLKSKKERKKILRTYSPKRVKRAKDELASLGIQTEADIKRIFAPQIQKIKDLESSMLFTTDDLRKTTSQVVPMSSGHAKDLLF